MVDTPETRASLLLRLRDVKDERAWTLFAEVYTPLVLQFFRQRGLQEHDAADLAQEVLLAASQALQRFEYDRSRGRFRGWLFTVVQNKLRNFFTSTRRHVQGTGDSAMVEQLAQQPAPDEDPAALWEQACEQQLFAWASQKVRERVTQRNWEAFWRTAVEGQGTRTVATELGLTEAAVRLAKSRVIAQICRELKYIEEE